MRKYVAVLIVCVLIGLHLSAQQNDVSATNLIKNLPGEELSLFTDRDIYVSGETIWFNIHYKVNENIVHQISNVVYVELFKPNGRKIASRKFRIKEFQASGSVIIPEETPSGNYILRAYTQYMRNFPVEAYSNAFLFIINPEYSLDNVKQKDTRNIELAIEGNGIIKNELNRVAVRLNPYFAEKVNGIALIDDQNHTLRKEKVYQNGLAFFEFPANDTANYSLKFDLQNKDSIITALPFDQNRRIQLLLTRKKRHLLVKIYDPQGNNSTAEEFKVGIYNESLVKIADYSIDIEIDNPFLKIPLENLPEGVIYFALFNNRNTLIDIKGAFGHIEKSLHIDVQAGLQVYQPRELVEVDVDTEFSQKANLTVNVVKKGLQLNYGNSLPLYVIDNPVFLQSFLLNKNNITEDMIRQIETVMTLYNKYLDKDKKEQEIREMEYKPLSWLPEIRDVTISGLVRNNKTMKAVSGVPVYLSVIFNNPQVHINKTQEDGSFIFSLNNLQGVQDIYIYPDGENGNDLELLINSDFENKTPDLVDFTQIFDTSHKRLIEELLINSQISKLVSGINNQEKTRKKERIDMFGHESITIALKDYIALDSTEEVFSEIVPYTRIRKKKDRYYCEVLDRRLNVTYDNPLVLIDNVPLFNVKKLTEIPPEKIETIGVVNETYIIGDNFLRGIVQVFTNTDNFADVKFPGSAVFLEYQAIDPPKGFEKTEYSTRMDTDERTPDFRNVLYHDPDLKVDGQSKTITFFTSDHCSQYEIIIKGFTEEGKPCYGKTTIDVECK